MFKNAFFYALMAVSLLHMVHLGLYVAGANIYDIWQFRRQNRYKRPHKRTPLVSVVIPAHNEQYNIVRTLESIQASTYRKVEIVVVDDGSSDNTAKVVRDYIKQSPGFKVDSYVARYGRSAKMCRRFIRAEIKRFRMVVVTQSNAGKGAAVNNGIQNHARGDLVMTLDADSELDPQAIAHAVRYFDDPRVVGVAANVRVANSRIVLGTLQKIEHLIGYRSKKFYTMTNCELIVGGVASTYRMDVLKEVGFYDTDTMTEDIGLSMKIIARKGNRKARIVYAADVLAGTEGVQTYNALFKQRYRWKVGMLQNLIRNLSLAGNSNQKYSRMLTLYRIPMAYVGELTLLIEPLLLAYILYLSVRFTSPAMIIGAYLTITLYVLWTIWPDEHLEFNQKLKASASTPFMYFIFYIMNAVQIAAIIRCLVNYKTITGQIKVAGTWESPERAEAIHLTARA